MKTKKILTTALIVLLALAIVGAVTVFGINAYVKHVGAEYIVSESEA